MCLGGDAAAVIHDRAMVVPDVETQLVARGVFFPGGQAVAQGVVDLLDCVALELDVQRAVGLRGAGQDHDAAGDLIQAVDDPEFGEFLLEQLEHIRGVRVPAIRQDGDAGGFVDDEDGLVLVENIHHSYCTVVWTCAEIERWPTDRPQQRGYPYVNRANIMDKS